MATVTTVLTGGILVFTGIKPMWEDEANKFGGKWIVRLRKGDIHPREADRHSP